MTHLGKWAISIGAISLLACHNLPPPTDRPALIAEPTATSRAELASVVATALGGREIRLAPDALTQTPILALEQGGGLAGPARGRILDLPERFELVLSGERCVLVRSRTGERFELEQARCILARP